MRQLLAPKVVGAGSPSVTLFRELYLVTLDPAKALELDLVDEPTAHAWRWAQEQAERELA